MTLYKKRRSQNNLQAEGRLVPVVKKLAMSKVPFHLVKGIDTDVMLKRTLCPLLYLDAISQQV